MDEEGWVLSICIIFIYVILFFIGWCIRYTSFVFINKKYKGDVNFYLFDLKRKENNVVFYKLNIS